MRFNSGACRLYHSIQSLHFILNSIQCIENVNMKYQIEDHNIIFHVTNEDNV